ncbi:hypothetical protein Fot_15746 [Forsythia ovata]|uniref:Uncharacterized protein n=1 Tax=Forsythia ovata TaxID=205694 RepID=A0ABD1WCP8_9LAMI
MTCRNTMCAQPKLILEISPGQSSWIAKVVVAEKNIARTAQPLLGLALGVLPRKVVQTKNGTKSHIQEVVLINDKFETLMLKMWDTFVEGECKKISEIINEMPVIIGKKFRSFILQ